MAAGVSRLSKSIATARVKHHPSTPKRLRQRSQPLLRRRRWSTKTPMVAAGPEQGRRTRSVWRAPYLGSEKNLRSKYLLHCRCTVYVLYTYWFALFVNVLYCLPWLLTVFILRLWSWSDYVGVGAPNGQGDCSGHLPSHRSCCRGHSSCSVVRPPCWHCCWSHFLIHLGLLPYQFCTSPFLIRSISITKLPKQVLTNGFKKHCNHNALQSTESNALLDFNLYSERVFFQI
jgi:hypothetical protein